MRTPASEPKVLLPGEGTTRTILGERYTWKVSGADSGQAYALIEGEVPPQGGPPRHVHAREDESFYVLEGSYEFRVGERVVRVGPGACVFGPRGIPHAYKNISSAPSRHLVIITPAGFEKFLEELSQLPPGPPDLEVLTRIARRYELVFV